MVYNLRDNEWIPNATDNPWANCQGQNPEHEYHVIYKLGWSLQLTNITLSFDVKSENIYHGKVGLNVTMKEATVLPITLLRQYLYGNQIFPVDETNPGHKHNAHMFSSRFQKHLYDEPAFSSFENLTKPLCKCNEDCLYYATQYQDILVQYQEGFNFITGKASAEPSLKKYT